MKTKKSVSKQTQTEKAIEPELRSKDPAQAPARRLETLPAERQARSLRQASVRQMQQSHGNAFVQRALVPDVSLRTEERPTQDLTADAPAEETQQITTPSPTQGSETGAQNQEVGPSASNEITTGGASVSTEGGVVRVSGGMVQVDAPVTNVSGVLRTDTLVATNVVGSNYTPGAGNLQ